MAELGPGRLRGEVDALQSHVATPVLLGRGPQAGWWLLTGERSGLQPRRVPLRHVQWRREAMRVWCVASTELLIQFQVLSQVLVAKGARPGLGAYLGRAWAGFLLAWLLQAPPKLPPALVSGWAWAPPSWGS